MIKKIVSIKNVGRYLNSASAGNPELKKCVLIHGANGSGKTTICAILRSLQTGNAAHIIGRGSLGIVEAPVVELLIDGVLVRFDGSKWSGHHSTVAIFDGVFVDENVHSGEAVNINHKRNLYRVIIGAQGIHLSDSNTQLAEASRTKTSEITAAAKTILTHIPAGMTLDQFVSLGNDPDIDRKIVEQEQTIEAVRRAGQIAARPALLTIAIPVIPAGLTGLLAKTLDSIAQDSEALVNVHLSAHSSDTIGITWIGEGLEHSDRDNCPFCGQDIRGLPLIGAYRAIFGQQYKTLKSDIAEMRTQITQAFGEGALGRLNTLNEQNKSGVEFWSRYCTFDAAPLEFPIYVSAAIQNVGQAAVALLDSKDRSPLEVVLTDDAFNSSLDTYVRARADLQNLNDAIQSLNTLISSKKTETDAVDPKSAEAELALRRAIRARHVGVIAGLCDGYSNLISVKTDIDVQHAGVRAQLDKYTNDVVSPYEQRINQLLDRFNAGFRIAGTKHGYPGGKAASSYQIVINDKAIDPDDGRVGVPSFHNTLSAGDRTTLAMAFFLARLERDQSLAGTIVVFDDPFSSQDAFRRSKTVIEIASIAKKCSQVIVLSHDPAFLKQVWDKVSPEDRVSLRIVDRRAMGSKVVPLDLEEACRSRTVADIDDLKTFLAIATGKPLDIMRKMRVVLEAHCRFTYHAHFEEGDTLGDIVRKIHMGGVGHPASSHYEDLNQINDYSKEYHHGEKLKDVTPDQIDSNELAGYVGLTLKVVNALQA